jgi:hypothetical protein
MLSFPGYYCIFGNLKLSQITLLDILLGFDKSLELRHWVISLELRSLSDVPLWDL